MTAPALQGDRERCLAAGMDDCIAKPVLVADIEAALWRRLEGEVATWKVAGPADWAESAGDVFDPDRLAEFGQLDSSGNGSALLGRLIDCFLARAPADLAALRAAIQRGDATALGRGSRRRRIVALEQGEGGEVSCRQSRGSKAATANATAPS